MKKHILDTLIISLVLLVTLNSCVQQSEYDKLRNENHNIKSRLDELENGAVRLLGQAQEFKRNNEFDQAEQKLKILFERHAETQEAIQGRELLNQIQVQKRDIDETENWNSSVSINSVESYNSYIVKYPTGKYVSNARSGIQRLKAEKEKQDFEVASNSTSASIVREFVNMYPNHPSNSKFKQRIIQLEVDEIFGSNNTGRLPTFEQIGYEYSATSNVSIKNDTGCELVVRYSGLDVKMIEIPSGGTKSITLSSSTYRIAASACGADYAGTEELHGTYSSSYYIRRY